MTEDTEHIAVPQDDDSAEDAASVGGGLEPEEKAEGEAEEKAAEQAGNATGD
jgi:hypothetical protein